LVFCKIFSFPKLPFRLEPELFISARGSAILFPDFPSASPNSIFARLCQSIGSTFQFVGERKYTLYRFPIAYPTSEAAVLVRFCENTPNKLLPIHLK
jgi:hypothetical protein